MAEKSVNASSSSSCWVVEMEKMLEHTGSSVERERWSKPSIYRVPNWLKSMTKQSEAYQPRLVSLGPFHHGKPDLHPMEEHKQRAVLHIVKRSGKQLREFIAAIEEVVDELLDAYHDLDDKWRGTNRGHFVEMMVTDGCFLLEMMKGLKDQKAPDDYADNDPVFSVHGMTYLWVGIRADMVVIENQLPLLALYRLQAVWSGTASLSAKEINKLVLDFMCDPLKDNKFREEDIDYLCLHPLDVYHKSFCGLRPARQGSIKWERTISSAVELKQAAGIHFEKSKTQSVHDIDFKNGVLRIPAVSIHDGTEKVFLNLMAFERLHPDIGSDATAYMIFMDNIIDSERDVALLRSKGIIKNLLSSDKEAAELYNMLSKGASLSPYNRLHDVRRKVNNHYAKTCNKWRAIFFHSYLRNPWAIISLVAAVILLVATLLQTVYTVGSFYKPG
uniref:Uncharacterized protein n=1 Tax=Arundo donax TaxID=35708 RepID=A0A0A8YGX6_ARUDO